MVMVRQQGEHAGDIVAARADLQHLAVEVRQGAPSQGFLERGAAGEVAFQLLNLRPQRAGAHPGAQLLERAFQREALTQHRRQLLVEEGKFVVVHVISLNRSSSMKLDRTGGGASRVEGRIVGLINGGLGLAKSRAKSETRNPKAEGNPNPDG